MPGLRATRAAAAALGGAIRHPRAHRALWAALWALAALVAAAGTVLADTSTGTTVSVDWGALIDKYGLPLAMLVAGGILLLTGRLRTGREVVQLETLYKAQLAAQAADYEARLVYAEARRKEEHDARTQAENRLDAILPAVSAVTGLLQQVKEELIRAGR